MSFYSISDDIKYAAIADNVVMREKELFAYDLNISNYTAMLANLPQGDWPSDLVQYQTSTLDQVPDELDETVSQYQYRDRLRLLIKTEKAERAKSFSVYQALLGQLPANTKDQLIAEAIVRANGG
jgi:hypothetical protein